MSTPEPLQAKPLIWCARVWVFAEKESLHTHYTHPAKQTKFWF